MVAFAAPEVEPVQGPGRGARVRRIIDRWSEVDLKGEVLGVDTLSTRLTKVAAHRQTLCRVAEHDYLIARLNRRRVADISDALVITLTNADADAEFGKEAPARATR